MQYSRVREILGAAFSLQTGLDEGDAKALYERAIRHNPRLRDEIQAALRDDSVDWIGMLNNDVNEIYIAKDATDARQYAFRLLSSPLLDISTHDASDR